MATADWGDRRTFEALVRSDFSAFARFAFPIVSPGEGLRWNWHLDAICHHLELVRSGTLKRLIIEVPPRSLKSYLCSVAFPAFMLGRDPQSKIITASYSFDLAAKHANDSRALIESSAFQRLFPTLRGDPAKSTEAEYLTQQRGYRYATSTGGTLTGRGGGLLILDDILKPEDAQSQAKRDGAISWYRNTLYSRLNDKRQGSIILVMQRLHIDDPAGHLRQQDGWTVLSLPAIAPSETEIPIAPGRAYHRQAGDVLHPEREPQSALEDIRQNIGSFNFSAQYQQEPVPPEGSIVKWRWFNFYRELPRAPYKIVQSWDVGMKAGELNDYSVCTTWAIVRGDYYLIDLYRARVEFPALCHVAIELSRRWRAEQIVIEDKVTGSALIQHLAATRVPGLPRPIAFQSRDDKVTRLVGATPTIEAGHVFLPQFAPWLDQLRQELTSFPGGRHDDQVDSISQFLIWARRHTASSAGTVRIVGR